MTTSAIETTRGWIARNPLRVWRRGSRTTLAEIAAHCGVGIAAVQNWEHGTAQPTAEHMDRIAALVDVTGALMLTRWQRWLRERD